MTPTRGNFSDFWINELLRIQGNVEFVLVYPPGVSPRPIQDSRVKSLVSPYRGEMMQRFVALLNATGDYVLALDDDDLAHPDIVELVIKYFERFPDSWVLRLKKAVIDFRDIDAIKKEWTGIPDIDQLDVCKKTAADPNPYRNGNYEGLLEVPIAPLELRFDVRWLFFPFFERKDNYGYHFENFNNIVWNNQLVQKTLPVLAQTTQMLGAITWIPSSGFDRLSGLFVQAVSYQRDLIIGHWLPGDEQIRYVDKPAAMKPPRFHVISDFLLVKRFPQYGYFWNLFFSKLYGVPRAIAKLIRLKLTKNQPPINALVTEEQGETVKAKG
ncbi:glycosyltransferase family A protein [Oscillatoria sp. FACHB-1407]|uniref:glycosyltransferase family A protein n=1 Tax=Oscillatoria sp. FACHB-1407 TaxID=2692847 RepID=UPI0030DB7BB6